MRTQKGLVFLAISGLILSACTSAYSSPISLNGTDWHLASLSGQSATFGTPVKLSFENGKISGTDGCNSYRASYVADETKLTIGKDMISTMKACPEPISRLAGAYLATLMGTATYRSDGRILTLMDANGATLATATAQLNGRS